MKKCIFFCCACILFSCNNEQKNTSATDTPKDTTAQQSPEVTPLAKQQAFAVLPFDIKNIPFKDSIKGTAIEGAAFKDAKEEGAVVLTETENTTKNGTQNKSIYAYCFIKEGNGYKRKWLVQDKIEDCDVDAICRFFPGSLTISDADTNQVAEITFLYELACAGDVSPLAKKLIMYSGTDKYAIRGATILQTPAGKEGGDKKIDASFNTAPKSLLSYAEMQWDKFGLNKY